ncbi:MAG TPA: gamma-glutamyltransferase, partial [Salinimicrobium sp.]|nr:gamma-glutamyltransferase [Salinimicrobium sp.]
MKKILFALLLSVGISSCKTEIKTPATQKKEPVKGVIAENAMVVSAREEASKIGVEILQKGGNAFDAMVATEMALAVAYPVAGNLGGGGFMVYRLANGETGALDYREKAPLAATKTMYQDENGEVIEGKSRLGALAVGVPGSVAGIFAVHEKFGSLPMEEILKPVIALARNGYVLTENDSRGLDWARDLFIEVNNDSILFAQKFNAGDTLKNAALAETLERIFQNGRKEFYEGYTARKL